MTYSTVADLTVAEFKSLVKEVVSQTLLELLGDPDEGFELREEIKERLLLSLAAPEAEHKSAAEVAAKYGVEW